jgi:hypothetical protein
MQGRDRKRLLRRGERERSRGRENESLWWWGKRSEEPKEPAVGDGRQTSSRSGLQLATQTQNAVQDKVPSHHKSVGQLFVSFLLQPSSSKIRPYFLDRHIVHSMTFGAYPTSVQCFATFSSLVKSQDITIPHNIQIGGKGPRRQ